MPSCRIAVAQGFDGNLEAMLKDWKVPLKKPHVLEMLAQEPSDDFAKYIDGILEKTTYVAVKDWGKWHKQGVRFRMFGHVVKAYGVTLDDGMIKLEPRTESWGMTVFVRRLDNCLVFYFMDTGENLRLAKKRLTPRLFAGRQRNVIRDLEIPEVELKKIESRDCINIDRIKEFKVYDKAKKRRVHIDGTDVMEVGFMSYLKSDGRLMTHFPSAYLTPKKKENDPTFIRIDGEKGAISASKVNIDTVNSYVDEVIVPVLKESFGDEWYRTLSAP